MLNKNSFRLIKIITLLIVILTFNNYSFAKHLQPKDYVCKPESERSFVEKKLCKMAFNSHRLCKLDAACFIKKRWEAEQDAKKGKQIISEQEDLIKQKEDLLRGTATCGDLLFNHKASKNTTIYRLPNKSSSKIGTVKKNQELLYISPSSKNKNWYFVKMKKDGDICSDGFIEQKFLIKKAGKDTVVRAGPKLIDIIDPRWEIEDKLIVIDAEGTVSITGVIQEGKIDKVIINEDEEIINDDNTFNYVTFVPKGGSEVRIIGSKNDKKVKELTFKIKLK